MASAAALLLLSLGFVSVSRENVVRRHHGVDDLPHRSRPRWPIGIALEIYGFYLRVRISSWAPVTNMYETVIWVALVAAVLSLVFEMIYRKAFTALAGAGGRTSGHDRRGQCPAPGPEHQEPPACSARQLLAVHPRALRGLELCRLRPGVDAWPGGDGLLPDGHLPPVAAVLRSGTPWFPVSSSWRAAVPAWRPRMECSARSGPSAGSPAYSSAQAANSGDTLFYVFATMALLGETITLAGLLALGGEVVNRLTSAPRPKRRPKREAQSRHSSTRVPGPCSAPPLHVKPLSNFIYRAMQVGVLLVAAGTILGGVWADYSWGRFWGWDPRKSGH